MNKVIAISGFPGSGKTSLMLELNKKIDAVCIDYDDYQTITERPITEISKWMEEGANYDDFVAPTLVEDLRKLKQGQSITAPDGANIIEPTKCIFFETPLGREHQELGKNIDIAVWIDVPLDVALARNVQGFSRIFSGHHHPQELKDDLAWLDMYFGNYLEYVRPMLVSQQQRLQKSADIVIDGKPGLEAICSSFIDLLQQEWSVEIG
jgi:uridine kinase